MVTSVAMATFLTLVTKVNMVKRKINDNTINHGKQEAKKIRVRTPLKSKFKEQKILKCNDVGLLGDLPCSQNQLLYRLVTSTLDFDK
jgi:hypothetical protein